MFDFVRRLFGAAKPFDDQDVSRETSPGSFLCHFRDVKTVSALDTGLTPAKAPKGVNFRQWRKQTGKPAGRKSYLEFAKYREKQQQGGQ